MRRWYFASKQRNPGCTTIFSGFSSCFFYIWTKTHTNMYYLRRANKLRIIEHNFIQHKHTFDIFGLFLIFWNFWHREKLSIILMNWIFGFYKIPAFDNNKKLKSFIHSTTLKKANQQYKKSNSTTLKREVFASPAGFLWINQAYPHLLWKMHSVQCILALHWFLQYFILIFDFYDYLKFDNSLWNWNCIDFFDSPSAHLLSQTVHGPPFHGPDP